MGSQQEGAQHTALALGNPRFPDTRPAPEGHGLVQLLVFGPLAQLQLEPPVGQTGGQDQLDEGTRTLSLETGLHCPPLSVTP